MRRKLFFGALTVLLFVAGFAAASFPARAELKTTTLADGQEVVTNVDPPPSSDQGPAPPANPKPSNPKTGKPEGGSGQDKSADDRKKRKAKDRDSEPGKFLKEGKARDKGKRSPSKHNSARDKKDNSQPNDVLGLGAAPIGVPNFVINKFRIPPFLLPIYQAAGTQYGIRWEVLAAINEIETDYGRNLNVSSAGAVGWMQFLPSTWDSYGVDANNDRVKDPYNPVDAVFAAARYLKAAGAEKDLRRAIFAYNHADWYVDSVLLRARMIAGLPADLVGSLTGLTQGHFPVQARARYANDLAEREVRRMSRRTRRKHNVAKLVEANDDRRSVNIFTRRKAPVVAVNDGVIEKIGVSRKLGRYVILQDVYGNRYTYAHLGEVVESYPVPRSFDDPRVRDDFRSARATRRDKLPKPTAPASAGTNRAVRADSSYAPADAGPSERSTPLEKERLFANPARENNKRLAQDNGQSLGKEGYEIFRAYFSKVLRLGRDDVTFKRLREGSKVIGGTVIGRVGKLTKGAGSGLSPQVNFSIRPAGRGAPRIDPKPILDGWKLLEATAIYRTAGRNPFISAGPGQVLLMSKETLARRVLADRNIDVYPCGRSDIRSGQIDRRVLAALAFLSESGLRPSASSLRCGHSYYTSGGGVSEHSSGNAVDIWKVNGIPIYGHQGAGSVTEIAVRRLLTLQGAMEPHQVISLLDLGSPSFAMADHDDHIHLGFQPQPGNGLKASREARRLLSSSQWDRFVERLTNIRNPAVPTMPSRYSTKVRRRGRAGRPDQGD